MYCDLSKLGLCIESQNINRHGTNIVTWHYDVFQGIKASILSSTYIFKKFHQPFIVLPIIATSDKILSTYSA